MNYSITFNLKSLVPDALCEIYWIFEFCGWSQADALLHTFIHTHIHKHNTVFWQSPAANGKLHIFIQFRILGLWFWKWISCSHIDRDWMYEIRFLSNFPGQTIVCACGFSTIPLKFYFRLLLLKLTELRCYLCYFLLNQFSVSIIRNLQMEPIPHLSHNV